MIRCTKKSLERKTQTNKQVEIKTHLSNSSFILLCISSFILQFVRALLNDDEKIHRNPMTHRNRRDAVHDETWRENWYFIFNMKKMLYEGNKKKITCTQFGKSNEIQCVSLDESSELNFTLLHCVTQVDDNFNRIKCNDKSE